MYAEIVIWAVALVVAPAIVGLIYAGTVELVQKIQR